ncbi:hypothetical protein H0H87_010339 [Tephrocybe sp. NHM501043]|nr:hypothetical protein H0H87_010339 [Tephrocybe sp. NHM501043]
MVNFVPARTISIGKYVCSRSWTMVPNVHHMILAPVLFCFLGSARLNETGTPGTAPRLPKITLSIEMDSFTNLILSNNPVDSGPVNQEDAPGDKTGYCVAFAKDVLVNEEDGSADGKGAYCVVA